LAYVKGEWITFTLTPDEVALRLDLAFTLKSQLAFVPNYVLPASNDNPAAVDRLVARVEG
jgi:hypothetical protein